VRDGERWTQRDLGWALLDELADQPPRAPVIPSTDCLEPLSERELEVLRLVGAGLSNRQIAARLFVTLGTVKKHLNNIFGKLGVERRTQAIARARELRLIA
jgi:LuxR family maltose regulon positive regulatory protein